MNTLAIILICIFAPVTAAAAPFLIQTEVVKRARSLIALALRRVRWFGSAYAQPAAAAPAAERLKTVSQGLILCACMIAALIRVGAGAPVGGAALAVFLNATILGFASGIAVLGFIHMVHSTLLVHRLASRFAAYGISGLWREDRPASSLKRNAGYFAWRAERMLSRLRIPGATTPESPPPVGFGETFTRAVADARALDALSCDGLEVFKALARNPEDLSQGPHPMLKEANVRLLVLPPRSRHVDPECQRLTCAEAALGRIDRSAEEQWRLLKHALTVRNAWVEQFGMQIDIRFIESRPVLSCLLAGGRAWMHPWPNAGSAWIELEKRPGQSNLYAAVQGLFLGEWAAASDELEVPLGAHRPGSTALHKNSQPSVHGNLRIVEV